MERSKLIDFVPLTCSPQSIMVAVSLLDPDPVLGRDPVPCAGSAHREAIPNPGRGR